MDRWAPYGAPVPQYYANMYGQYQQQQPQYQQHQAQYLQHPQQQQQQWQPAQYAQHQQQPAKRQRLEQHQELQRYQQPLPARQQLPQTQLPQRQQEPRHQQPPAAQASRQRGQEQQQQQQRDGRVASPGSPAAGSWLDKLQAEIEAFTQAVVPDQQQQAERDAVLRNFEAAAKLALPEFARTGMGVTMFGSGAAGLALHTSDLDVAITSIVSPNSTGGFDDADKNLAVSCLRRIERAARWGPSRSLLGVSESRLIGRARVPVLKLQLGQPALELDVSLNDDGGLKAARFVQSFQGDYPAIKPLTLLLKCILKQRSLAEVYHGGLGSWSLVNMVIAHLMDEDRQGHQVDHVGVMLMSFLRRFGCDFNVATDAVAVQRGGFAKKAELGMEFNRNGILALHDPLTGREVAGGSHRYNDVIALFERLHRRLKAAQEAARQQSSGDGSSRSQRRSSSRHGQGREDDSDDDGGYDTSNRSPTYARVVRQGRSQQQPYPTLALLLDCQQLLQRPGGDGGQRDDGSRASGQAAAGQWQWGNGVPGRGTAGHATHHVDHHEGSRKRDRWHM